MSHGRNLTVTAVIPAFNAGKYIGRAVESVLAQTLPADEIIVVDDGSTDDTADVVKSFGDKVRFIQQAHGGASVARNTAINAATGEWIAFLDADDEWLPQKLEKQVALHARHPDLVWSATHYEIRPIDGSSPRPACDLLTINVPWTSEYRLSFFEGVAAGMAISTITIMVRKTVIEEVGMFCVGQFWAQDTDLFFRIAYRKPEIGFLTEFLSVNHFGRPQSITQLNKFQVKQRCDLIEKHLRLAAKHNMSDAFRPCAQKLLTRWLRGYAGQPGVEVAPMLDQFDYLLPRKLQVEIRWRQRFPRLSRRLLAAYNAAKKCIRSGRAK